MKKSSHDDDKVKVSININQISHSQVPLKKTTDSFSTGKTTVAWCTKPAKSDEQTHVQLFPMLVQNSNHI
jgi:hypothetical protein